MSIVYSKLDLGTMIAPLKGKHKDIDSFVVHTTTTNTQLLDFALAILYSKHHTNCEGLSYLVMNDDDDDDDDGSKRTKNPV